MQKKTFTNSTFRRHVHVDGVVQGVGFRPFVYNLAHQLNLTGWVRNTSAGVDIEIQGTPENLDAFAHRLRTQAPPLALIEQITAQDIAPVDEEARFEIRHSAGAPGISLVAPDVATCPDCLQEVFDAQDRRYRYPFTNCTNCGPRFTIIQGLPYDRPQTTMAPFEMCTDCRAEYEDPTNRRFHAQPNACPKCGPFVGLFVAQSPVGAKPDVDILLAEEDSAIRKTAELLASGAVIAIKGLGGFHLACDATYELSVKKLRDRKGRPAKPFAVMMCDLDMVRKHCRVGEAEAALLTSPAAPIVLLERRPGSTVAAKVAPGNPYLGVMLPYTPLHHILLHDTGRPLVMTSGNHTDEPLSYQNTTVIDELGDIADAFLLHDRAIHIRADDSVMMVIDDKPYPVRRSRGYAPYPVILKTQPDARSQAEILAVGAQMKNTLCFLKGHRAFLSQHIGELDNLETLAYFEQAAAHLKDIFRAQPAIIAHDMHPDYLSTRWAKGELRVAAGIDDLLAGSVQRIAVQHHHAHIASCLADNDYPEGPRVTGLAWDGTGYGEDNTIWGSECLIANRAGYERLAHLAYAPLPGGEASIKRPARLATAYLHHFLGQVPDLPGLEQIEATERRLVKQQIARNYNTAWTSSMGRLFDVVAAMVGLCPEEITFEAQAAIALEMLATQMAGNAGDAYRFPLEEKAAGWIVQPGPVLAQIADELVGGAAPAAIAARFHAGLADLTVHLASKIRERHDLDTVALSGGVWQNRLLLRLALARLRAANFKVLIHRRVPPNDGGLSLGQAVIAQAKAKIT